MSEALPFIGAAIGSFTPIGAQGGWMIGSALAFAAQPGQKSYGARLSDLKVTGMAFGQPIPWIQGTHRTAGQLIYSSDRREIATTTSQGKGGAKSRSTTFTYEIDCLILLSSNELDGLLRVWNNGKLVYSVDADTSDASLVASSETELWRRITFYGGAPDQMPDPTYEAAVGAGNAPAYRDMCTVFIEGLQLGQSGQMLNLTFEVGTNLTPGEMQSYQDFSGNSVPVVQATSTPSVNRWGGTVNSPAMFSASGKFDGGNIISPGEALEAFSDTGGYRNIPRNFSIRAWLYDTGDGSAANQLLAFGNDDGNPAGLWVYRRSSADAQEMYAHYRGSPSFTIVSSIIPPKNQWYYFELSKVGDTVYMFIEGKLAGTTPSALDVLPCFPSYWCIGGRYGFSPCWHGYIDDFVYTSGSGSNTAEYWPPTMPHVPDDGTLLYIPFYRVDTVQRGYETVRTVVERLCARAGMPAGTYDASALDAITKPVRALAVSQVGGTRGALDMLAQTFFFQVICTDKVYFVPRAQSVVATIPFRDLGTAQAMADNPEPFALKQRNDLEVPAQEAITYANVSDDYQSDTQYSDRLLSSQTNTATSEVPLGFTPSEAKAIADAKVTDGAIAVWSAPLSLPRKYSRLTPGDSVLVEADDGSTYRMLLGRLSQSSGVLGFEARLEDPTVFTQAGITGGDYNPQTEVAAIPGTSLLMLDIPLLRDADDGVGIYSAARGLGPGWPGGEVFESTDDLSYTSRATHTESAVFGVTQTALGNWTGANVTDETNTVTVNIGPGALSSITDDQLMSSTTLNAALIGNEIVQFKSASMLSAGVYLLSGFLRGLRGTDRVMTGHAVGERFVLLQPSGMRRIDQGNADLHAIRYFRGVSIGRLLSTAAPQAVINTGVSVMPFRPADAQANRATTDTVITFNRRTRMESRFLGPLSSSVPLGEAIEAYQMDIFTSNAFTTVVRTLTSTTPSFTYTSAQQVADFGSNRTVLYVDIYQMSETVGRGFPLRATI